MNQEIPQELVDAALNYESLFVPALFKPWTKHLLSGAGVREGQHLLDVACGTGVLARDALTQTGPAGRIVGVDIAPGMLAAAEQLAPEIEWLQCSADALALEPESFDCVVSQFGLMFFPDRQAAVNEAFRVLKPGGHLAVAVWNTVDHNPAYADVISVLQEEISTEAADALRMPYCLGDPDPVTDILSQAGFKDIHVDTKTESGKFPSSRHMVEAELRGWLPLFDILLSEAEIQNVLVNSDALLSKYATDSGEATFPTSAHILTASK